MEWYIYFAVIFVGFVAGFINTLAGGGSLLTLPLLIFLGLPANVANGTNRIVLLLQNIVGVSTFKKQKAFEFKEGYRLAIPAILGSVIGAQLAVGFNEDLMRKTIGGLLLFMFFIILYKPEKWIKGEIGKKIGKPTLLQIVIFFFIGIYGGFIQAGVGFFILAGLVLGAGADLVKANALKVFIVLAYTIFALAIFMINHQVNYEIGIVLAVGNMAGAFIAAKFAMNWGAKFVRYVLLVVVLIASAKLLGLFEYISRLF